MFVFQVPSFDSDAAYSLLAAVRTDLLPEAFEIGHELQSCQKGCKMAAVARSAEAVYPEILVIAATCGTFSAAGTGCRPTGWPGLKRRISNTGKIHFLKERAAFAPTPNSISVAARRR